MTAYLIGDMLDFADEEILCRLSIRIW